MKRKFLLQWTVMLCILLSALFPPSAFDFIDAKNPPFFPVVKAAEAEDDRITLAQLAAAAAQPAQLPALQSPIASLSFQFSLPADWQLEEGTKLDLSLTSLIASMMPSQGEINYDQILGGTLSIAINGKVVDTIPIQGNGKKNFSLLIPLAVWQNPSEENIHSLDLQWDASLSCNYNLIATVAIDPQSFLTLPHQIKPATWDISQYPAPFFIKNGLFTQTTTIVIPSKPSTGELEAAFTITGGLVQMSSARLDFELVNSEEITTQQLTKNHLIVIGRAVKSPQLEEKLSTLLQINPADKEAVFHLVPSPWNSSRGVLILQAQDDESLANGAKVASRGTLLASQNKAVSIIRRDQAEPTATPFAEDTTFAGLGIADTTINRFGSTTITIPLNIPPQVKIGAEAYLDLIFSHAQVADYLRSAITVRLNNIPIGSVRFSDSTAGLNTLRSMLPPTIIRSGHNEIQIQVDLYPRQICSDERLENLWVNIFSNSFLHLPVVKEAASPTTQLSLADYDSLFGSPQQIQFLLSLNQTSAVQAAFQLNLALAAQSSVDYQSPKIIYAGSGTDQLSTEKHWLLIGLPSELPQLSQFRSYLAADFTPENLPAPALQPFIPFKVSRTENYGYLSIGSTGSQSILLISGSNPSGLSSAIKALLNPRNHTVLVNGNFAIVQGNKASVLNLPIRGFQSAEIMTEAGQFAAEQTSRPPSETTAAAQLETGLPYNQPEPWLLPTIIASALLIALILGYKILSSLSRTSTKRRL